MNAAPLLVSFSSVEKYLSSLPEKHLERYQDEIRNLHEKNFPAVVSPYCLSVLFGYSREFIHAMSKRPHKFYRTFSIRQGKKWREINSPRVALKAIQKWAGFHLSNALTFPDSVYGFVKSRSFVDAAKVHIGARWVYSVDIKDFFPSVNEELVTDALERIGYSENGASLLCSLCTLNGSLAQGSPASPVLSNIIMKPYDERLLELSQRHKIKVTRYADDIVFSGTEEFDEQLSKDIVQLFEGSEFRLNPEKDYFADTKKGQRLKVHGLLVKDNKVTLSKGYRNKIRAYKHMLAAGKVDTKDLPRINGHIKFAEFVMRQLDQQ